MSSYSFQGQNRVWTQRDEEENQRIFGNGRLDGILPKEQEQHTKVDEADYLVDGGSDRWPVRKLIKLLRLYGSHRCLWDVHDPFNKNRIERRSALIDIKEAMGDGLTMEQLTQKINVIRSTYRYEKRRIKERIKRGQGARTKLKWFSLADSFLRSESDPEDNVVTVDPETLIEDIVPENQNYIDIGPDSLSNLGDLQVLKRNKQINHKLEKKTMKKWFSGIESSWEPSMEILKAYQNQECLWNFKNSAFHDDYERERALKIIGKSLEEPLDSRKVEIKLKEIHFLFKMEMKKDDESRSEWFSTADTFLGPYFFSTIKSSKKTEASKNRKKILRKWKESDTLEFVELFKRNPCLWGCGTPEADVVTKIASETKWPEKKIVRQIQVLNTSYYQEKDKVLTVPGYISKFVWFSLVDGFMSKESSLPPLSPVFSIKSEILDLPEQIDTLKPLPISKDDIKWTPPGDDLLDGRWSLKQSVKFLRLYGAHRCLWDLKDPDYRNKLLRDAALEDIASCMGHGLDPKFVDKKVKIFRITYMQERKRLVDLLKENKEPEIQLKWFPLADCFLRPHIGLRAFKNTDPELPQFDYQYVYSNLNLIDPELLNSFEGKGSQNFIKIGKRK